MGNVSRGMDYRRRRMAVECDLHYRQRSTVVARLQQLQSRPGHGTVPPQSERQLPHGGGELQQANQAGCLLYSGTDVPLRQSVFVSRPPARRTALGHRPNSPGSSRKPGRSPILELPSSALFIAISSRDRASSCRTCPSSRTSASLRASRLSSRLNSSTSSTIRCTLCPATLVLTASGAGIINALQGDLQMRQMQLGFRVTF